MATKSGGEARALTTTWSQVAECDTFSFHSYRACWDKSTTTAPTDPASADDCQIVLGLSTVTADHWIHRSDMDFGVGLWACQNAACTEYYGDGTRGASVTNDTGTASTEELCYVAVGVTDEDDEDRVLSETDYPGVTATGTLMYPSGWTNQNKLGIWWSYIDSGEDTIKMMHANDTGWQAWNTYTNWSSVTLVAESGTGGPTDIMTHPWVVASDDGNDKFIRMFLQANAGTAGQYEVYSMDSTDEEGTDFGLECTTGGGCTDCAYGDFCDYSGATLAIDADGDAGDDYIDSAAHGRIMWSYVAEGAVDFTSDSPGMLFTGDTNHGSCAYKGTSGPDDIFRATWNSSSSAWDIVVDTGSPTCPVSLGNGDDQHDPGVTPLPNGEFATFVRLGSSAYVYYWDPATSTWGDGAEFKICYDHATGDECGDPSTYCTEITADCIGNIDSLVTSVGSPNGGLFFLVKESGASFAGGYCTDGVGSGKPEGILFADGQN